MTKPLRTLTYTLTADDALAFANLQRDYKGWGKALFYAWIACAGLTLVLLRRLLLVSLIYTPKRR